MAVGGHDAEFAHAPGLVPDGFADLRAFVLNRGVIRIDIVDFEIGEVGVVSEIEGRKRIRTLSCEDGAGARRVEQEPGIGDGVDRESENVAVEGAGFL